MNTTHQLTREEARRQIAELQRRIDSLPKNNHPAKIDIGMLFKFEDDIFMVTGGVGHNRYLHLVSGSIPGCVKSSSSLFGLSHPDEFIYIGHARDLLTVKSSSEVVVTDDMVAKAMRAWYMQDASPEKSWRHVIQLILSGKL